jgi:nitrogen regulatory protein PII 2
MKEITAIIRMDMVNKTKEALLVLGFPAISACKVMGRGRKKIDYDLLQDAFSERDGLTPIVAEQLSEIHRLMPKRMIMLVTADKDVLAVVNSIIEVNKNGNPGNGKIFITKVDEAVRIRTGESGIEGI